MAMAAEVADLLHLGQHVVIAFTHADDQMSAEVLRSENFGCGMENFPIFVPAVRRLDAGSAGPVENFAVTGVERDGEDIGADVL